MPLADGTLTDIEYEHFKNRLIALWNANGGRKPCRSCGSEGYYFHPSLIGNRSDTLSVGEPHTRLPTVGVYCSQCGLLDQYAARIIGIQVLLPSPPPSPRPVSPADVFPPPIVAPPAKKGGPNDE